MYFPVCVCVCVCVITATLSFNFVYFYVSVGSLSGISLEVPPLQEVMHPFSLYFLVPGEYTLLAAAVIDDATDVLRARARTDSSEGPIFCRGSPFHVQVLGTD